MDYIASRYIPACCLLLHKLQYAASLVFSWFCSIAMTTDVLVCDDVIVEILAKLPVKSLLRFNCVSKTWYSVISDPQFSNSLHRRQPSVLICESCDSGSELPTIRIESLLTIKDRTLTPPSLPWEKKPNDCYSKTICLGSCNGLVCVSHSSDLIIWNPSTRKFRRLPRPRDYSVSILYSLWTFVWFGYDESIHDYKLVWLNLSHIKYHPKVAELDVFTLKSNTWRRSSVEHIAVVGSSSLLPATGVLSNGAIHWISRDSFSSKICILVLDLATEKLRVLNFPHAPLHLDSRIVSLEGGCLCLFTHSYRDGSYLLGRDFWIMKEYGVDSSWTKLLSFPFNFIDTGSYSYVICPILLSKEGKEMVLICTVSVGYPEGRIVKLRVEEGGKVVKNEETLLHALMYPSRTNNVILHMEESLVSIFSPSSSCRKRKGWRGRLWNFFFSVRRGNNRNLK